MKFEKIIIFFFFSIWLFFSKCTELFNILKEITLKHYGNITDELQLQILENKIKDSIIKASEMLNLENFESSNCEPNFTSFCPQNWYYLGDGIHCKAGFDYTGPCERVMDFTNKTPLDKLRISNECKIQWPCKVNKLKNFPNITKCPKFWYTYGIYVTVLVHTDLDIISLKGFLNPQRGSLTPKGAFYSYPKNICIPHESYMGICNPIPLEDLIKNKEKLTLKCDLEWDNNLFTNNLSNFNECPLGYNITPVTVTGPPNSNGPDSNSTNSTRDIGTTGASTVTKGKGANFMGTECTAKEAPFGAVTKDIGTVGASTVMEICIPDEKYKSKFKGQLYFKDLQDKLIKTYQYNLLWNFKILNEEYLDEKCPYQWKFDSNTSLCLSPSNYHVISIILFIKLLLLMYCIGTIFNFMKFDKKLKNIWSNICLADFYPNIKQIINKQIINENSIENSLKKKLEEKFYKNGAIERNFNIIKKNQINKIYTPNILQKQLKKLYNLKKSIDNSTNNLSTNDNFLSTLQYTIDKLEKKIISSSFIKISSNIIKQQCPYNWDVYENICIAPKSYQFFVPNCFTIISRYNIKSNPTCKLQFDEIVDEDYVREPCPEGWKIEQKLDGKYLRTICRIKFGEIKHNFIQCGTKVDFTNISPNFKRIWSYICNSKFPSKSSNSHTKCKENFYKKCPYDWKEDMNGCIAPNNYIGPCDKYIKFNEISTPELKQNFSRKCLAFWNCLNNCQKNYSQVLFKILIIWGS
ncbi:uncharacterized protein TA07145 [Theileria annulata]|uniref:CPW-WPC domain-containing protein n=1 Tax=Theileria annulata TaxID=5874 RepID=Q4UAB4_THEAN|nr:uncharacterized protein TA07145 [Theileria annulata]CAI76237.1 hypothetical protein, conserved [Theileria annulata]|eukprot:XP_952862.1 hypothetical protein, conserved [Theileria annulata]